ncbi:MAG: SurA N-terminal domain-containing protein [Coprobacter sp.]|nr:SurA N-terminal domain-containing protein [Coprobacter sp.]
MATLEKIRSKAGVLVSVVIGVALLAFIVGDFLSSGNTFHRMNQDKVVVINGKRITTEEFQNRVQARTDEMQNMYKQYGMSLPEGSAAYINKEVFDQMVNEVLLEEETAKLGIVVSTAELTDLMTGDNIVPQVRQLFSNPQTGTFDRSVLLNFLNVVLDENSPESQNPELAGQIAQQRQMWIELEKNVKQQRQIEKFFNLMSKSVQANKLDIEAAYEEGRTTADFAYVMQPYSSIPDSMVEISASELKALYDKNKKNYKQDERRVIKYFAVDIVPSEADYKAVEQKINELKESFATTSDVAGLLSFNTDVPYVDAYVAERSMDDDMKAFVSGAQVGDVEGPVFADNAYRMYRLMGKTVAPDSVKVRHIMFPLQQNAELSARFDSLLTVLKNGGDFAALAQEFSMDQNSAQNGGDMDWMTETSASQLGQKFVNAVFNSNGSEVLTVDSPYGRHIVQVTERTAPVAKAKVAQLVLNVRPSSDTYNELYNGVSQYIAVNNNPESFEKNASEKGYTVYTVTLNQDDIRLGSINDARKAVNWAFNTKKGAISEIYNVENKFVVAALADVQKQGYADLAQVEPQLKMELMSGKKADLIISSLKEKNLSTLESYAQEMGSRIDTAKFVGFNVNFIVGLGYEPALNAKAPFADLNTVEGPVKGNNGVYVFTVYNKTEKQEPMDVEAEIQKYRQSVNQLISGQLINALKEKADIEDNRIKFY